MNLLAWTNRLPDNWEAMPLRSVADYVVSNVDKVPNDDEIPVRLCNYMDVYNNEFITPTLDFMRTTASETEIVKFGLAVDDVLITKDSESWDDIGVPALVRETAGDLVCGYHLALIRPFGQKMDGAFLFRCLQAKPVQVQLELAANGVTRFGIPKFEIGAVRLPIPPLPQQRAIADYLDGETARLDALVAEKERVLTLLAEKRVTLITNAVTRGLDPDVPLRDSGIPWLGDIPVHWALTRLKFVGRVQTGLALGKVHPGPVVEYPYLRVANVQDGFLDLSEVKTVSIPVREAQSYLLRAGDVLMTEGGDADKLGRGCVWSGAIDPCLHQNHVFAVRMEGIAPDWLALWMSGAHAKAYLESRSKQSTNLASISATNLMEMPLTKPSDEEQTAIVGALNYRVRDIDRACKEVERSMVLLKERRAALVAAAVTGRIDISATS